MAENYLREVVINRDSINTGYNYPTAEFMINLLGHPAKHLTNDCGSIDNQSLNKLMTYNFKIDHIKVSGLTKAVNSLKAIFAEVKIKQPELYKQIDSAGMLCPRLIRGSKVTPSNHSWGAAIDIAIKGKVDDRGDGKAQYGLLLLYPHFHNHGWYWAAGYHGEDEDAMHFEAAEQTLRNWYD